MLAPVDAIPMISVEMLGRLLKNLSDAELSKLPPEKLPETIPQSLFRHMSDQQAAILQDILMQRETARMRQHVDDMEKYGHTLAEALQQAETSPAPAGFEVIRENVQSLAQLAANWNQEFRGSIEDLSNKCNDIQTLLRDMLSNSTPMIRAESVLVSSVKQHQEPPLDTKRLSKAIAKLRHKLAPVEESLSQFHSLRLSITHHEMAELRKRIKDQATQQDQLQEQIDALRHDLEKQQSTWRMALARYRSSAQHNELQEQISRLITQRQMSEIIIDDEELRRWLDAIIEASLDSTIHNSDKQRLHAARLLLFSLLDLYCQQQEAAAMQIAKNPFAQIDAKQAVEFMLASERFILDYFAKKQQESVALFRTTAETRRIMLDTLKLDIIKELKRNLKKLNLH